ncbi:hypothetical protein [Paractinoplanes lichenicola]|uniref:Uncharacterized protein n=1 Tax=Paractinoplanes lichenicola TaxID=2802976 RepID=A0ABS1VJC2_9ACTN|nr:hypothetical protein [Actinoplanes lichenicola]MBL7254601.1 hypothetical protein [Actinoplanes lichenicola]
MAFGLPIAVTVGWTLATPVKRPAAVGVPGGEGALGAAPVSTKREPVAVRYTARPNRPAVPAASVSAPGPITTAPSASAIPTTAPPTLTPSPTPSSTSPTEDLPPLNQPPVPTPTEISTPPSWDPPSWEPPSPESSSTNP